MHYLEIKKQPITLKVHYNPKECAERLLYLNDNRISLPLDFWMPVEVVISNIQNDRFDFRIDKKLMRATYAMAQGTIQEAENGAYVNFSTGLSRRGLYYMIFGVIITFIAVATGYWYAILLLVAVAINLAYTYNTGGEELAGMIVGVLTANRPSHVRY